MKISSPLAFVLLFASFNRIANPSAQGSGCVPLRRRNTGGRHQLAIFRTVRHWARPRRVLTPPNPFFRQVEAFIEEQEKNSGPITAPEIADYRDQFQRLKGARARLAKFRPNPDAEAKAKAIQLKEKAGEALPAQLNRTWPEFLQIILATKRKGRILQGTPCATTIPLLPKALTPEPHKFILFAIRP